MSGCLGCLKHSRGDHNIHGIEVETHNIHGIEVETIENLQRELDTARRIPRLSRVKKKPCMVKMDYCEWAQLVSGLLGALRVQALPVDGDGAGDQTAIERAAFAAAGVGLFAFVAMSASHYTRRWHYARRPPPRKAGRRGG